MSEPRTHAVILSSDGAILAHIETDIPSGDIEYAWNSIPDVGALINPRRGTLSRDAEHLDSEEAARCTATARCVHRSLRRFKIEGVEA